MAPSGEECTACPTVGITPLQNAKSVISGAVDTLAAGGNTNLPAGLAWAWRVLTRDPPFEHTITTEYTPDRAIVLMTDGENCRLRRRVQGGVRPLFQQLRPRQDECPR